MKRLIYILFLLPCCEVWAQQHFQDTLVLEEINVYGASVSKYLAGSKVEKVGLNGSTLNDAIAGSHAIYFKNYGNGQLSTISFRGTSASHTSVLWNGIPVNSPTLGQTDFSLWPSFLLDEVSVQYGNAGARYGSGAIGGTVLLESAQPELTNQIALEQQVGSFGHFLTGVKTVYGSDQLIAQTKLTYKNLDNDFSYQLKGTDQTQTQQNAAVRQYGVAQDVFFKPTVGKTIAVNVLGTLNNRQIQPTIYNNNSSDQIEDQNLRTAVSYNNVLSELNPDFTLAYIFNDQVYSEDSRVRSKQISALGNVEINLGNNTVMQIGSNYNHFIAESDAYEKSDGILDLYSAIRHQLFSYWHVSFNLRQSFSAGEAPLAPSIGQKIKLWSGNKSELAFKTQIGRSYRLPTLNDRYWQPGGNPDLSAEESWSVDAGFVLENKNASLSYRANLTGYKMWVDNWILWLPENGVWSPINIKEVHSSGLEFSGLMKYSKKDLTMTMKGNYSYTVSQNKSVLNANDQTLNNQLPYVPLHQGVVVFSTELSSWKLTASNEYTGLRYASDDNSAFNSIDAFNLLHASIGYKMKVGKTQVAAKLEVRNILDSYYENLLNRAMPGRHLNLTIQLNFNQNKNATN